jgi:hypothetical protein
MMVPIIAASVSSPAQDHSAFPKAMRRKSVNDKQSLWMKKLQEQKDGQKGAGGADQKRVGRDDAAHSPGTTTATAKRSPISSLWLNTIKSSAELRRESYSSAPLTISEIRAEGEGQGGGSTMTLSPDAPHSSSSPPDPSSSSTSSTTTEASTTVTNTES